MNRLGVCLQHRLFRWPAHQIAPFAAQESDDPFRLLRNFCRHRRGHQTREQEELFSLRSIVCARSNRSRHRPSRQQRPIVTRPKLGPTWFAPARFSMATILARSLEQRAKIEKRLMLKPAMSLRAKIISLRDVPAGAGVGYGSTFSRKSLRASPFWPRAMETASIVHSAIAAAC